MSLWQRLRSLELSLASLAETSKHALERTSRAMGATITHHHSWTLQETTEPFSLTSTSEQRPTSCTLSGTSVSSPLPPKQFHQRQYQGALITQDSLRLNHPGLVWMHQQTIGVPQSTCLHSLQQWRTYKSLKKSMKPINSRTSRLAVEPYLKQRRTEKQEQDYQRVHNAPIVDTVLPEIPQVPVPTEYRAVATVTGEYQVEMQPAFAVVQVRDTQFKVTSDDILFVPHMKDVAVNQILALDRVMLLGTRSSTVIGRPWVPNACVLACVEEHFKDGVVHVYKFKKRNRYRKYRQVQQPLTTLRILRILEDSTPHAMQAIMGKKIPAVWFPHGMKPGQGGPSSESESQPATGQSDEDEDEQEGPKVKPATA